MHVVSASDSVKGGGRQVLDFTWVLATQAKLERAFSRIGPINPD